MKRKSKSVIYIILFIIVLSLFGLFGFNERKINITTSANNTLSGNTYILANGSASQISKNNFLCREKKNKEIKSYDDDGNEYITLYGLIRKYWAWVILAVPIALIGFITYDFFSAMMSGKDDSIKKASSNAIKRVIAALVLLISPVLVEIVLGWFGLGFCF